MESTMQQSAQQLMMDLKQRMDYFEAELQKNVSPSPTVASLAAEFAGYKAFTMSVFRTLQEQMELATQSIDRLEMRTRRKILLIHGIPEQQNEDTTAVLSKVVSGKLKLNTFSSDDISRCHRMGRAVSSRPRPILVKLRDVTLRDKMWFSKAHLKDTGITLSEFLTKARHDVFMKARQHFGVNKCWTREGNVYVAGEGTARHRVNWMGDLEKLIGQPQLAATASGLSSRSVVSKAATTAEAAPAQKNRRAAATTSKK